MTTRKLSELTEVTYLTDTDELMANSNGSVKINVANFRRVMARMDINEITNTNSYTLALTDAGRTIEMNNTSTSTITIPNEVSVPWYNGSNFTGVQTNTGTVTLVAGSGVTINKPATRSLTFSGSNAVVSVYRSSANVWIAGGDLALV